MHRSFNSYYGRGHAYTCTWLLDCAVKTEETFQYFLFAEPKIPTNNQLLERGLQQCEEAGNLKQGCHTRKTKNSPTPRSFPPENIFPGNIDQQEIEFLKMP